MVIQTGYTWVRLGGGFQKTSSIFYPDKSGYGVPAKDRIFYPQTINQFSDHEWDIASGEAYFLGEKGVPSFAKVNDNSYDYWKVLSDASANTNSNHIDGFRSPINVDHNYDEVFSAGGYSDTLENVFSAGPWPLWKPAVLTNAAWMETLKGAVALDKTFKPFVGQLEDVRLVSSNLARILYTDTTEANTKFDPELHRYTSGYAFDSGYQKAEKLWHSGVDIDGATGDAIFSPISGTVVGVSGIGINPDFDGANQYILIQEDNEGRIWLIRHLDVDENVKSTWTTNIQDGVAGQRVEAGTTKLGTVAYQVDKRGNDATHIHVVAQDSTTGSFTNNEYSWGYNSADGSNRGQGVTVQDVLNYSVSPLQAFYEFNREAALQNFKPVVFASDAVTVASAVGAGDNRGGGGGSPAQDVYISSIVHSGTVLLGSTSQIAITAVNASGTAVTSNGAFFAVVSDDTVLSSDDQILFWNSTDRAVSAYGSLTAEFTLDWSKINLPGAKHILAGYFNADDPIQSNNYLDKAVNIVANSFSDIAIVQVSGNTNKLIAGDTLSISAILRNNGDVSSGNSTLNLFVNNGSGWVQIDSIPLANLAGGSVAEARLTGALPNGFSGAVQTKVVVVNGSDSDTTNNELSLESFYVDPLPVDDIGVAGLAVTGGTEYSAAIDTVTDTDTFNISVVSGGVYRFEISEYDLVNIRVIDPHRSWPVGHHAVDGNQGGGAYIFQAVTTGIYKLEISSNGTFTGGYTLAISGNIQDVPVTYTNARDFVTPNRYVSQIHDLMDGDDIFTGSTGSANYTVYGGLGQDGIWGGSGNDKLYGGEGVDNLFGGRGDDYLSGGNEFDNIQGGPGNDRIFGGAGNDGLSGDAGYNYIYGGSGDDSISARAANSVNYIDGGTGIDKVSYINTFGDITINLMTGTASGGAAQGDTLISIENILAGHGNDTLIGNDADNQLVGVQGNDILYGGFGNDRLIGNSGDDKLYGGDGDDYLAVGAGLDEAYGGSGNDLLYADAISQSIFLDGDVFYGDAGDDTVKFTGAWADYSFSINGDAVFITDSANLGGLQTFSVETFSFSDMSLTLDQLILGGAMPLGYISATGSFDGTDQNDWIVAFSTSNSISGYAGDDQIIGNSGADVINGGSGSDQMSAGVGADVIVDPLGDDYADGGAGHDSITIYSGTNIAHGGDGSDHITGGIQGDQLYGDAGNDIIRGDVGSFGGADLINGGTGNDVMMGGIGADVFVFAPNDGTDIIAKFNAADVVFDPTTGYSVTPNGADFEYGIDHAQFIGFNTVNTANVLGFITDTAQGTLFSAEGTSVLFYGIDSAALTADDFIFA